MPARFLADPMLHLLLLTVDSSLEGHWLELACVGTAHIGRKEVKEKGVSTAHTEEEEEEKGKEENKEKEQETLL